MIGEAQKGDLSNRRVFLAKYDPRPEPASVIIHIFSRMFPGVALEFGRNSGSFHECSKPVQVESKAAEKG
jgi:hypothetical protein